jgi:hypothetical protein
MFYNAIASAFTTMLARKPAKRKDMASGTPDWSSHLCGGSPDR